MAQGYKMVINTGYRFNSHSKKINILSFSSLGLAKGDVVVELTTTQHAMPPEVGGA